MIYLILGGARSGKSRHAETIAKDLENQGKSVIYIATAQAFDDEMAQRIDRHRLDRPSHWTTIETPIKLADTLSVLAKGSPCVIVVDCLTLWLSNLLCDESDFTAQKSAFLSVLDGYPHDLIFVSNETGMGVVPMGQLTRRFVDESGFLHQAVAGVADRVVFCVAGIPMTIKGD